MKLMLTYFEENYYTDPLSFILAVLGVVLSFKLGEQSKRIRIFRYYLLGYMLLKSITYSTAFSFQTSLEAAIYQVQFNTDFWFTLLEYFVFAYFLSPYIDRKIIYLVSVCFATVAFERYVRMLMSGSATSGEGILLDTYLIQALSLLVLCINYYITIYRNKNNLVLEEEPSFWIATGLTFFMVSTLPFSIFSRYLHTTAYPAFRELYSIFYLFYSLLFLIIIKAFTCERPEYDRPLRTI